MVAQVPAQQPTNPSTVVPSGVGSSTVNILMADSIDLTMQAKSHEKQQVGESSAPADSPPMPQSNGPLTLEKPTFEAPSHPSKWALRRTTHNLNARTTQHYSIIEDLAQALCVMLALEVLQSCPTQRHWGHQLCQCKSPILRPRKIVNRVSPTPSLSRAWYVVWEKNFITQCWMRGHLPISCHILVGRL